jgi:hypothetical protein
LIDRTFSSIHIGTFFREIGSADARFAPSVVNPVRFEDVVRDDQSCIADQERFFASPFPADAFLHSGSVQRWGSHPDAAALLEDTELRDLAERHGNWPSGIAALPLCYRTVGFFKSEWTDIVLAVGRAMSRVDPMSSARRHVFRSVAIGLPARMYRTMRRLAGVPDPKMQKGRPTPWFSLPAPQVKAAPRPHDERP